MQAAAGVQSEGSRVAEAAQGTLAKVSLRASAASRWQRFAPPPSLTHADHSVRLNEYSASSASLKNNRTGQIDGCDWGSWLAQHDAPHQNASHSRSPRVGVTQGASAWQVLPHEKQSVLQSAAMFVTAAD
jgi:hypothetical protein